MLISERPYTQQLHAEPIAASKAPEVGWGLNKNQNYDSPACRLVGTQRLLNCSLGANPESRVERFHLDTLRVAEVVPHLGLPVLGHNRRHALWKSWAQFWEGPGPARGEGQNLESRMPHEPLSVAAEPHVRKHAFAN